LNHEEHEGHEENVLIRIAIFIFVFFVPFVVSSFTGIVQSSMDGKEKTLSRRVDGQGLFLRESPIPAISGGRKLPGAGTPGGLSAAR
jgi:hypothetical protein